MEKITRSARTVVLIVGILSGTKHHSDYHRRNGCCGLDGMDGPNLVCPNAHEVGTEKSDCWMPHAAVLLENVSGVMSEIARMSPARSNCFPFSSLVPAPHSSFSHF